MREKTAAGIRTVAASQKQAALVFVFSLIGLALWSGTVVFGWDTGIEREIAVYLLWMAGISGGLFVMGMVMKKVLTWRR